MNTEKLTGKVIVITGAASGMGAAMAKDFSAREAKIAIFDMDEKKSAASRKGNTGCRRNCCIL